MKAFHIADLSPAGELVATAEYVYEHLSQIPGASALIAELAGDLYRSPREFDHPIDGHLNLCYRWKESAQGAGVATLRQDGRLTSLGLLASGISADADHITLQAFQSHLLRELHNTRFEPAFDLLALQKRPLLVTVGFQEPAAQAEQVVAALADRCFAAAYFRFLALV